MLTRKWGVRERGVDHTLLCEQRQCLVGVWATNRLAELSMQTQARLPSRPCTFPCLHSDFVTTISGEAPILCLLGKNKLERLMMIDRTLS